MNTADVKRRRVFDFAVGCISAVLIFVPLIALENLPGLYLDAINPDYAAVQILFPHENQVKWMVSWPWLTQLYHGNITVLFALLSILITGTTSVLQHHIVYGILAFAGVMLLYGLLVMKEMGVSRYIAAFAAFFAASVPSLMTIIITQYYIEIFGTVCILLGMILYFQWKKRDCSNIRLMFCYALFGLAFYSYFNYLFFLPALLAGTALSCAPAKRPLIRTLLQGIISYLTGCSFYFIGYTQILIGSSRMPLLLFCLALYGLLAVLLWLSVKGSKLLTAAVCAAGGIAVLWMFAVLPAIRPFAESLNITGQAADFLQKITFSFRNMRMLVTGESAEVLMYGSPITSGRGFVWGAEIVLTIVVLLTGIIRKTIFRYSDWKEIAGWILCYFLCTIILASRMQSQHFVPFLFLLVLLLALEVSEMKKFIAGRLFRWGKPVVVILAFLTVGNNLKNGFGIISQIQKTGGIGRYSDQINVLAADALSNADAGIKEVYVFYEWGFLFGFNYLTQNRVEAAVDLNVERLSEYVDLGYRIVVCYWEQSNESMYEEFLESWEGDIAQKVYWQRNDDIAFYTMSLDGKE